MPFSDLILVGLVTLFLTAATVWIVWYVVKAVFPDEVTHLQFLLTFIVVIIPFVLLLCFGSALISPQCDNYTALADAVALEAIDAGVPSCGSYLRFLRYRSDRIARSPLPATRTAAPRPP
jgi:hypothetical protein